MSNVQPNLSPQETEELLKEVAGELTTHLSELVAIARKLRLVGKKLPKNVTDTANAMVDAAIELHIAVEVSAKKAYPKADWLNLFKIQLIEIPDIELLPLQTESEGK